MAKISCWKSLSPGFSQAFRGLKPDNIMITKAKSQVTAALSNSYQPIMRRLSLRAHSTIGTNCEGQSRLRPCPGCRHYFH